MPVMFCPVVFVFTRLSLLVLVQREDDAAMREGHEIEILLA